MFGDAEFSNFSYLNDLKSGRCEVSNPTERLSELQRRNTLCLPHLKSSYPVEMQAQLSDKFKDEELKASVALIGLMILREGLNPLKNSVKIPKNVPDLDQHILNFPFTTLDFIASF